jgi:trk system potassium uptake protein TrkA
MHILICGAGQVGYSIARQLSREDNQITVIDTSPELVQKINEQLDARAYVGFASHPTVLKAAGADDADMLIAVTYSDEVNMVACQIGYSLFNIPTRIARIRHQDYLRSEWSGLYHNDHMALNVIISPEVEVARAVHRRLSAPGALDLIPFADGLVKVLAVRCLENSPAANLPVSLVRQKAPKADMKIIGLLSKGKFIVPTPETVLHAGDDVYLATTLDRTRDIMVVFGHHEQEVRRAMILGGGNIGLLLAQELERDDHIKAKIVEYDIARAESIAAVLHHTTVINGSALDREILVEAGIEFTESIIAVTNDDETNILSSLLGKRYGAERAIALINNANYNPLIGSLGIDVTVNPRDITTSCILEHVRRGRIFAVHAIADGMAEILEAEVMPTSSLVGKSLTDIGLPKDIIVGAIIRGRQAILPESDTVIQEKDHVIILATANMIRKVEKIFSVSVEFF